MATTEMCMFYLRGACRFGNRCWNSHEWSDWTAYGAEFSPSASMELESDEECNPSTSSTSSNIGTSQQGEPNTQSAIAEPNTQSAIAEPNTQSAIAEPNTQSAIAETNTQSAIAEPNTQSAIAEPDTQSAIGEPDTQSAIGESQQDTIEEEQIIVTAEEIEAFDDESSDDQSSDDQSSDDQSSDDQSSEDESSNDELIKSTKNNAEDMKETAEGKAQLELGQKLDVNKEKTEWDEVMMNEFDTSLQCNVCMEIFIKPTVLNCSHTFCELCILLWMRKAKKCPMCRMDIRSRSYCLTLDTFIEKVVEFMPKEVRLGRKEAIKNRSEIHVYDLSVETESSSMSRLLTAARHVPQHPLLEFFMASPGNHEDEEINEPISGDDDIDGTLIHDETEVMSMNLHDLVLDTGGRNPLSRYPNPVSSNQRWPSFLHQ